MKTLEHDFSGIRQKLQRARELLQSAEGDFVEPKDTLCDCGECDGYYHVLTENGMRMCREGRRKLFVDFTDRRMNGKWEDWNPFSFPKMLSGEKFHKTDSFQKIYELYSYSLVSGINPESKPRGLILLGGHGRSKTLSSLILIWKCAENCIPAMAVKFPDLVAAYKLGIDGNDYLRREYGIMDKCRVVFVDELGRQACYGNQEHARTALDEIVSRCYRMKFLVITSNFTKQELHDWIEPNIASRFSPHAGYMEIVEEPFGEDLRNGQIL
jgi:DNA replication protein DnaC